MDQIRGQLSALHHEISRQKRLSDSRCVVALSQDCAEAKANLTNIFKVKKAFPEREWKIIVEPKIKLCTI
jgi:hypothetical protein